MQRAVAERRRRRRSGVRPDSFRSLHCAPPPGCTADRVRQMRRAHRVAVRHAPRPVFGQPHAQACRPAADSGDTVARCASARLFRLIVASGIACSTENARRLRPSERAADDAPQPSARPGRAPATARRSLRCTRPADAPVAARRLQTSSSMNRHLDGLQLDWPSDRARPGTRGARRPSWRKTEAAIWRNVPRNASSACGDRARAGRRWPHRSILRSLRVESLGIVRVGGSMPESDVGEVLLDVADQELREAGGRGRRAGRADRSRADRAFPCGRCARRRARVARARPTS